MFYTFLIFNFSRKCIKIHHPLMSTKSIPNYSTSRHCSRKYSVSRCKLDKILRSCNFATKHHWIQTIAKEEDTIVSRHGSCNRFTLNQYELTYSRCTISTYERLQHLLFFDANEAIRFETDARVSRFSAVLIVEQSHVCG